MLILWVVLVGVFASLVLLPPGRPAAIGIGVAVLAVVALWATDTESGDIVIVVISGLAIVLAGVAQLVRRAFGDRMSRPVYLLFALGLLLSVISSGLFVLAL